METSLGLKRVCLKCNRSQVVSHDVKQHTPRCKFLVRTYRFVSCWPRKGWFWLESRSHDHPTWQRKRITKEKAKKIGIKAFVMKPLVMRNLAETVRKVLDENDTENSHILLFLSLSQNATICYIKCELDFPCKKANLRLALLTICSQYETEWSCTLCCRFGYVVCIWFI